MGWIPIQKGSVMADTFTLDDLKGGGDTFTLADLAATPKRQSNAAVDVAGGILRGAGSIGATLMTPIDAAARALGIQNDFIGRTDRREAMDNALRTAGADPESLAFKAGKIGAEIAGTAGVGGALARPVAAVAPGLASALQTGGLAAQGAGLGTRIAGGAITGGASAGLINPEDAGMGAAIGGAFPVAVKGLGVAGNAIGRSLSGGGVSQEVADLAKKAQTLGIEVPADRIANSKPLNALAATLNYVPFSGRAATEQRMQEQLNRAVSRTFGQDSNNVTMALRGAADDLGQKFDNVLKNYSVRVDNQFIDDLIRHEQRAASELETGQASIIKKQIEEILSKASNTGEIDGQAAYNIKKTLDRIGQRNTPEAFYANDLKRSLMGALDRSLPADVAQGFAKTRQQYGTMLDLQKLAKNGAEGDISIGRLANMKNIGNRELQDLADISAQFLTTRENPHGALQRLVLGGLATLTGGIAGAPVLAGAIGASGLGRGINSALNSNLARGLLIDGLPEVPTGLLQIGAKSAPALIAQ